MRFTKLITIIILTTLASAVFADTDKYNKNDPWGIAMGFRIARIPYPAAEDQVSDVIPLLYFDSKYFFMKGPTGGIKLYTKE